MTPPYEERAMFFFRKDEALRRDPPPLDLEQPAEVRTATFALG
jgi:hypothetical protein